MIICTNFIAGVLLAVDEFSLWHDYSVHVFPYLPMLLQICSACDMHVFFLPLFFCFLSRWPVVIFWIIQPFILEIFAILFLIKRWEIYINLFISLALVIKLKNRRLNSINKEDSTLDITKWHPQYFITKLWQTPNAN